MAARELTRRSATRYCVFYIDSFADDAKKLPTSKSSGTDELSLSTPCAPGSIANAKDGKKYILGGDDTWTLYQTPSSGGGGGGGGGQDYDVATDEEVNEMIDDVF